MINPTYSRLPKDKRYLSIHSPLNKWSKTEEEKLIRIILKENSEDDKKNAKKINNWAEISKSFPNRTAVAVKSKYLQICKREKGLKKPQSKINPKVRYSEEDKTYILRNVRFLGYAQVGELISPKRTAKAIKWAYYKFSSK